MLFRLQNRTLGSIGRLFARSSLRIPPNSPRAPSRFRRGCRRRPPTASPVVPERRRLRSPRPPRSPASGACRAADRRRREPSRHLRCEIPIGNTVPTVPLGTDERDHERMDLDSVADALYALAPEEFTAARDEAANKADPTLKKAIKALRKPTVAAHAVNRLVRDQPDDVDG